MSSTISFTFHLTSLFSTSRTLKGGAESGFIQGQISTSKRKVKSKVVSALEVVLAKTVIGSLPVCMVVVSVLGVVVFWSAILVEVLSINSVLVVRAKKIKY